MDMYVIDSQAVTSGVTVLGPLLFITNKRHIINYTYRMHNNHELEECNI